VVAGAPVGRWPPLRILRVVVTGSESTGKTTLARDLALRHDTAFSPEFAREYVERKHAPLTVQDVPPIARGQLAAEDQAERDARRVLFLDTDLWTTVLYARHYYGSCPAWIEETARRRRGDLYLLNHPDVPWVAEGLQRDRGGRREEMHALFVSGLRELGARVVDVCGPWPERWATATAAVDGLLAAEAHRTARQ
jgi:NadR type nicotinamide-nucleotide adenylyltransferase